MFVGHYGPAYALKARYTEVPLWALFLGVQAVDVAFFLFVPLGIEHMRLVEGPAGPLAMDLVHMPYTHSLLLTLVYLAVCVGVGRAVSKPRLGIAMGLAVASHWVCDLLVHVPDLPLTLAAEPKMGFGLWRYHGLSFALELALIGVGYVLARRSLVPGRARRWGDVGLGVLVLVQTLNSFVLPPPTSTLALSISAEVSYLVLMLLVVPVDRSGARPSA